MLRTDLFMVIRGALSLSTPSGLTGDEDIMKSRREEVRRFEPEPNFGTLGIFRGEKEWLFGH